MINDTNHIANSHSSTTNGNSLQKSQSITSEKP